MSKRSFSQNFHSEYKIWERIAFTLAGTDKDALRSGVISQRDEDEQKIFGWSVFLAGLVTFINVYLLGEYLCKTVNAPIEYAFFAALIWALFIMNNDKSLFNDVDIKKLWVRILFLVVSAIVFSYGIQLKVADSRIEEFIRQEVAEHNVSLEKKVIEVREKYGEKIQQIESDLREASAMGNDWVRRNGTYVNELRRQKNRLTADMDSMVQVTRMMNEKMIRQPDLSVYNRMVVYKEHFWMKDIVALLLGILILVLEGLPIFFRIKNRDSDYLYYNYFKRKMSRAEWRRVTLAQKVKLYHNAEQVVRERFAKEEEDLVQEEEEESSAEEDQKGQLEKDSEWIPRFNFDKL